MVSSKSLKQTLFANITRLPWKGQRYCGLAHGNIVFSWLHDTISVSFYFKNGIKISHLTQIIKCEPVSALSFSINAV